MIYYHGAQASTGTHGCYDGPLTTVYSPVVPCVLSDYSRHILENVLNPVSSWICCCCYFCVLLLLLGSSSEGKPGTKKEFSLDILSFR